MSFVYILQDKNGRFYIGCTNSLKRRLEEHKTGQTRYTSQVLPIKLVFSQEFENSLTAKRVESWLKKQKSSKFIARIISEGRIEKTFS